MAEAATLDDVFALVPVIPVLTIERVEDAVALAGALVAGGLPALEVTLRTPAALEAIRRIAGEVEGAVPGVGTVLNPDQLREAADAGARFAVSPGMTAPLLEPGPIPLLLGAATASDVMRALDAGLERLKFFPAAAMGGAATLKAFAGPFPQVRFCPTGGINPGNASDYLSLPNVACVGGAWVAPTELVRARDFMAIERLAAAASQLRRR